MKTLVWSQLDRSQREAALARPGQESRESLSADVAAIIGRVRQGGDAAVLAATAEFDGVQLEELAVSEAEIQAAVAATGPELSQAIEAARSRIHAFHAACAQTVPTVVETAPGVTCERVPRPISPVGLYVPAGRAPLPSTALMLAVPAQIAGCESTVLCTPPDSEGKANPAVLAVAHLCGVKQVFKAGGAQAIAAMAYGTQSVPKCFKLFGPGNAWVTEAKLQVSSDAQGAAIDMPAGPSEVMVVADGQADPEFVAIDLLSQAEHGPDSQAILVTDSAELADRVAEKALALAATLPTADTIKLAMRHSRAIVTTDLDEAMELANRYASEHLILQVREPRQWQDKVQRAGSVFLGAWSPEAIGDYCSGTNHVLPTYGFASNYSGVSVASFQNFVTFQELTPAGLGEIGPTAEVLARAEGLAAHEQAVSLRLARLGNGSQPDEMTG